MLLGVSMGGGAAFTKVLKYPHCFKVAAAIFPPLNLRWISCRGRYMDNFDPCCWGWRENFDRGHEVVARFYGVITVRLRSVIFPLYGRHNPDVVAIVSENNPIELLDSRDVKPGDVELYVAYGGKDEFNLDAQIESFLYRARETMPGRRRRLRPQGHAQRQDRAETAPRTDRLAPPAAGAVQPRGLQGVSGRGGTPAAFALRSLLSPTCGKKTWPPPGRDVLVQSRPVEAPEGERSPAGRARGRPSAPGLIGEGGLPWPRAGASATSCCWDWGSSCASWHCS